MNILNAAIFIGFFPLRCTVNTSTKSPKTRTERHCGRGKCLNFVAQPIYINVTCLRHCACFDYRFAKLYINYTKTGLTCIYRQLYDADVLDSYWNIYTGDEKKKKKTLIYIIRMQTSARAYVPFARVCRYVAGSNNTLL